MRRVITTLGLVGLAAAGLATTVGTGSAAGTIRPSVAPVVHSIPTTVGRFRSLGIRPGVRVG